jgi:hypothetical protein
MRTFVSADPSADDRHFFETHPNRRYRVRLARLAEVDEFRRLKPDLPELPDDFEWFVAVHRYEPGVRFRQPISAPDHFDDDPPEDVARVVFLRAAGVRA